MDLELHGKIAFITCSAVGIGFATAREGVNFMIGVRLSKNYFQIRFHIGWTELFNPLYL